VIINIVGIRWFARVNNVLTSWKVLIPVLAIVVFLVSHFHSGNFSAAGGFFVNKGGAIHNILVAIPAGGIVFSLLGFEQAVQLGSEARNPKDIPRAVIASIFIGATIYILVQVAFIGAIEPSLLAKAGTWTNLGPTNNNATIAALNGAPFYTVAKLAGLTWLAVVLRLDAAISPGGTALIYETSTSRLSFGLSKNGYIPSIFERIWERTRVPVFGIIISGIIGVIFLLPFPSWTKLVGVVTDASVIMYAGAPLAMGALRLQKPDLPRLYRLPAGAIIAPIGFILANEIIYFTGWAIYSTLMVTILIGYALMLLSAAFNLNANRPKVDWRSGMFVFPYMIGMGLILWFGNFGAGAIFDGAISGLKNVLVGGNGDLPNYWDFLIVAAFSLGIYQMAMYFRLRPEEVDHNVRDVYPPPMPEH
jgi:amino acid transporter